MEFFAKHETTLKQALAAIASREFWSPYPESPRAYGEEAQRAGEKAFEARLHQRFNLGQASQGYSAGSESSPYGTDLEISYPVADVAALVDAATQAKETWARAGIEDRVGACLEILDRLVSRVYEMAYAVMHTTGQAFLMAFQTGGPHALDRGLEAVAYAYSEMRRLPGKQLRWEKQQGKRDPLQIDKQWRIRPSGIAVTVGAATFPTWNGYPGVFASLATGNPVIVTPHPETILPLAIFVETAREVVGEAGFDPNVVQLAVETAGAPIIKELVMDPAVAIVDYTGGCEFGEWLEQNVTHALVFTEKEAVNSVVIDSAADLKGVFRNLAVSLSMYSGQMFTTPQNVYVPRDGIDVDGEHVAFETVATGLARAIGDLLSDDQRAGDILGSIKSPATVKRISDASTTGEVLLASREITHTTFPRAEVHTPIVVGVDAADRDAYLRPMFGPVVYVIGTAGTDESLALATESALRHGAITWLVYTTSDEIVDVAIDAATEAGVSVAFNLTGGLYVNQSAAFSDFHVTGANPAGNASTTDAAFIAGRFRAIGVRIPV